ncbi:MAG: outer membrane beta-barrel protein [Gammaproteobacteria bacterium]
MKKITLLILFLGLFSTSSLCLANEAYFGASVGESGTSLNGYNKPLGYKAFLGAHINDRFGIELGLVNLGEFKRNSTRFELTGIEISAVGFIPVGSNGNLFAKIGLFNWDIDYPGGASTDGSDVTIGIGVQLPISGNTLFRFEYQEFRDIDASNVDFTLLSIGLALAF